jgi:hypothetical protein
MLNASAGSYARNNFDERRQAAVPRRRFSFPENSTMSTQAQITANQANAQHSTGPRSETGKQASSQNNLRHGFAGQFKVLDWEEQSEFVLVEKMAQHFWLSQRSLKLQEQCFRPDLAMKEADAKLGLYLRYQTTHDRAFRQSCDELRKLRNEKRKEQIGFESQEQEAAQETRKQEKHEARFASRMPRQCTSKSTATSAKPSKRRSPATCACLSTP